MTSKQLLVLSFLALFLVFADSQSANLSIAIQSNVCVNVEFANETECYYKAKDPLTFTITFTRKANKKCKKLVQQLDKQTNITIAAHRCEGRSNSIQAHMSVEQLNWICERRWAIRNRFTVKYEREPNLELCREDTITIQGNNNTATGPKHYPQCDSGCLTPGKIFVNCYCPTISTPGPVTSVPDGGSSEDDDRDDSDGKET
ncbi:uncharacterized protein [Dysidea avara]|uniref:uncharacterized protein n=1 Tax=Dysidea avara TaxID=196820 RepID=UPI003328CE24